MTIKWLPKRYDIPKTATGKRKLFIKRLPERYDVHKMAATKREVFTK